jgi:hypothetical protein
VPEPLAQFGGRRQPFQPVAYMGIVPGAVIRGRL